MLIFTCPLSSELHNLSLTRSSIEVRRKIKITTHGRGWRCFWCSRSWRRRRGSRRIWGGWRWCRCDLVPILVHRILPRGPLPSLLLFVCHATLKCFRLLSQLIYLRLRTSIIILLCHTAMPPNNLYLCCTCRSNLTKLYVIAMHITYSEF